MPGEAPHSSPCQIVSKAWQVGIWGQAQALAKPPRPPALLLGLGFPFYLSTPQLPHL
jgi:hypothetical protein